MSFVKSKVLTSLMSRIYPIRHSKQVLAQMPATRGKMTLTPKATTAMKESLKISTITFLREMVLLPYAKEMENHVLLSRA